MSSLYQHSCKVATVKGWAMYRQIPSSVKKTDRLAPLSIHGCGIVRIQAGKTWRLLRYQQGTTGNKDRCGIKREFRKIQVYGADCGVPPGAKMHGKGPGEQPLRPMALLNRLTPNIGMALRRLSSAEPSSKKVAA